MYLCNDPTPSARQQAHGPVLAAAGLDRFAWHPLQTDHAVLTEKDRALDWEGFVSSAPVLCFSATKRPAALI